MLVCKAVHLSPPLPAVIICLLVTDTFPPYTLHIPDILHHRWTLAFVKAQTSVQPYSFLIGSLVELSSTDTSCSPALSYFDEAQTFSVFVDSVRKVMSSALFWVWL